MPGNPWRSRFSVNQPSRPKDQQICREREAVASRDHTARWFASFRIIAKRVVVDALLNLKGTNRFGGVGGFINVSRHRDNLLVDGLGAFLFGKSEIPSGRIALGNGRLICRLISQESICDPGIENLTW